LGLSISPKIAKAETMTPPAMNRRTYSVTAVPAD
jgi:hypothetical protein